MKDRASLTLCVVTPSYNQGKFIRRTIESVLNQPVPAEYVIMDGGSQDETLSILKEYDGRLNWASAPDKGQADGVNKGIQATSGDVIGWINSDDVYYPGAFKLVMDVFEAHPEVDVLYGKAYHIDVADQVIDEYYTEEWNLERLFEVCYLCQPAVFFRRRLIEQYGLLDLSMYTCMDYELWVRWGLKGVRFYHLHEFLAGSRLYPENKTLRNREKNHHEFNDMLKMHLGKVPERWIHNYGYAVGDTWNIPRERKIRFSITAALATWYASIRWNRELPLKLVRVTSQWVLGNIKGGLQEAFKR